MLCITEQDPVIFSATIRYNLDPFSEHADEELWGVLESVNMKDTINRFYDLLSKCFLT